MGGRKGSLLEKTAQLLDLPADAMAGVPSWNWWERESCVWRITRGFLAYGSEEIHISAGSYVVRVTGRELELRAMTGLELLITGQIADIRME